LTPETLRELWAIREVVAVKESSGDLRQIARICQEAPADRVVLAGDDDLALAAIAVGATGLVSVCGNVAPAHTAALVNAAVADDLPRARELFGQLAPLMGALFSETNPVPLKAALACLGLATGMVRSPLVPAAPDTWARVQSALSGRGWAAAAARRAFDRERAVASWPPAPRPRPTSRPTSPRPWPSCAGTPRPPSGSTSSSTPSRPARCARPSPTPAAGASTP